MINVIVQNWRKMMRVEPKTPAFVFACNVACWKLHPAAKFSDMPDEIRYAHIDESVTPDQLCAELIRIGFDEKTAKRYSAEPSDQRRDKEQSVIRAEIELAKQQEIEHEQAESHRKMIERIERRKQYAKEYRARNPDKIRKAWRKYIEENREQRRAAERERYRLKMEKRRALYDVVPAS